MAGPSTLYLTKVSSQGHDQRQNPQCSFTESNDKKSPASLAEAEALFLNNWLRDFFRRWACLEVLLGVAIPTQAQLDNGAFIGPASGKAPHFLPLPGAGKGSPKDPNSPDSMAGQLRLSVHAFTFSKDNEYFNKTADCYTLFSTQLNPQQMAFHAQLRARQPSGKPGVIAVMRRRLLVCFSLWKNDRPYDPHYHPAQVAEKEVAPAA